MKDGKSINQSPLYDPSAKNFYKNRELRFYADIVYNGSKYRGRSMEFYLPGGIDSKDGPSGDINSTRTGYTIRKYMDESYRWWETSGYAATPRVFFRLAEFYLNYAEAEYHLGNYNIAIEYVNKIRNRVNLPDINSSGTQLLKDIRHERNIELVFEGHRFYDARRWMTAGKKFGEDIQGIQWKYVDNNGNLESPENGGQLTYEIFTLLEKSFPERQYYIPIPADEIRRTNLKQNDGY